jgi:hypothetical protein
MSKVTITLEDTAAGGVSITSDYTPTVGAPCSAAQAHALEIINRTRRDWDLRPRPLLEIDIDAVHRRRDRVLHDAEAVARVRSLVLSPERGC